MPKRHHHALEVGDTLHWYTIQDILGQGGFGITYLAHDENLKQSVAIKEFLPAGVAARDSDSTVQPLSEEHEEFFKSGLDRFLSEARTLTQFDHKNIVRVISVFEMNNTAYMVMRYEKGKGLDRFLPKGGTLDEELLKKIITPMIGGLSQVHATGFIHRDIKPPNIFIRTDLTPVLIDFGSARHTLGAATHTLTAMISPGYAPFEQYHAKSNQQGPWTDIYGLGATLYRCVAGEAPADALERSEAILRQLPDPYRPCMQLAAGRYTAGFLSAIDHALMFHENERPQTLKEWLEELHATKASAKPPPPPVSEKHDETIETPPERAAENNPTAKQKPEASKSRNLFWFILLLLVIAAFVIVQPWRALQRLKQPPSDISQTAAPAVGDTSDFIDRNRQSLDNNPDDLTSRAQLDTMMEYHRELARQALQNGDSRTARQQYRQAIRAASSPQAADELRRELQSLRQ